MSLEQQQQEETQSKVTNQYRVEITEFQEDSEESEGKKFFKNAESSLAPIWNPWILLHFIEMISSPVAFSFFTLEVKLGMCKY